MQVVFKWTSINIQAWAMCGNPHTLFPRLSSTYRRQDLEFWQSSSRQKTRNQNKKINMTRKCCRTQNPDRNTCSRGADTIILFASKKRCFELMLFLMVSACRRGILAWRQRLKGLVALWRGMRCLLVPSVFLQMHWESLSQALHLLLKWAVPSHVTAAHFAGSFPPGSPKAVKISTSEIIPK